ncbi:MULTISPECIES: Cof-type HAD-IIB family hydrolase [Niastella]|uniref:HAD family phosphatase n=1 Tax=Niastella soli TaxID=2821487 RepID=A0ABS3YPN3_9BACT|nr:Cof-type HAD-IIB family hydrolase [Niastella soli]MBO9199852.1 HAD family phosphatase [Niastella soli]
MKQTIKAIFFDIDGTLITTQKVISKNVITEIQRVQQVYKTPMYYISARMPQGINTVGNQLKLDELVIAYTGALIMDDTKIIRESHITPDISSRIIKEVTDADIEYVGLYSYDSWYVNSDNYWTQREILGTKVEPDRMSIKDYTPGNIHKIMLRDTPEKISVIDEKLRAHGEVNVFKTRDTTLEIFDNSCSKAVSVKFMSQHFNIPLENMMAIGDSEGDKEMIQTVGYGIAMGNAEQEIKKIAFDVTSSNDEDGVAEALKKYFP